MIPSQQPPRPSDVNQLAKLVVDIATGVESDPPIERQEEREEVAESRDEE